MSLTAERYAENRGRIAVGVAAALEPIPLSPEVKTAIDMVVRGEGTPVVVGIDVVAVLFKHRILDPAVVTFGESDPSGWRQIVQEGGPSRGGRVCGYRLRQPDLLYSRDLGGEIVLEAVRKGFRTDYDRWEFKWQPQILFASATHSAAVISEPVPPASLRKPRKIKEVTSPTQPDSIIVAPVAPEEKALEPGEIINILTGERGRLLLNPDGQPLTDKAGLLLVEFPGSPKVMGKIPLTLIGRKYLVGGEKQAEKT